MHDVHEAKAVQKKKTNWDSVVIGVVLFLPQLWILPSTIEFQKKSIVTTGEVVRLNAGRFHPEVAFVTRDGEKRSFSGSTAQATEVGDRVEVRYRPANPSDAEMNELFSLWGLHIIWTGVTGAIVILGFLGVAPDSRRRAKND
ncbi:DUF3592 domain-containing protein [Caballeronia sp. LZ065]|uniref:DUF3592 domain-containing protein n=1 Tax=Caballeronia sp. LZ065 TaxID=3038571 RepID=UPI00285F366B|nr:DUF3592 domain-containing protein [Caballeronia sp. LZ065]MDR5783636.1 DUF3592 domain-containing protein [Caballeronia sp. LZ065]